MPNDEHTPIPMVHLERECYARHIRTNEKLNEVDRQCDRLDRSMVDLVGPDGATGRVKHLETKVTKHDDRIQATEKAVAMGYVIAGAIAAVASVLGSWLMGKV